MGVVIPFAKRADVPAGAAATFGTVIFDAIRAGGDQARVMAAARPLLDRCRDRYGFVVMLDGLPRDPQILGRALVELFRGLTTLDIEMGAPRTYPTFGVYFGRRRLAWFEDGYSGDTGLAVPNDIKAADLACFVRPRVAVTRSQTLS